LTSFFHPHLQSASFSIARELEGSSHTDAYDETISNLKIGSHTRVIFQGFTGRQVRVQPNLTGGWLQSAETFTAGYL